MGWFFKKGVSKHEFHELIDSMKLSFKNVKKDITSIQDISATSQEQIQELNNIIGYLNQSLKASNSSR